MYPGFRRRQDPREAIERDLWGDIVEAQVRRRDEEARALRGALPKRVARWGFAHRMQAVPLLVIAGLFLAGLGVRAAHLNPAVVGGLGLAGLVAYYWWRAVGASSPAAAMLRPALAVAYLVASAVVA